MSAGNQDQLNDQAQLSSSIAKLRQRVDAIRKIINPCLEKDMYTSATPEDRVKYDLFISYALTALFWAYLRTSGVDPQKHSLRQEVDRIRSYIAKAKSVHDRRLRPKVNQGASKRFVKNALWDPDNKQEEAAKKRKIE